jgi:hypothetical protein
MTTDSSASAKKMALEVAAKLASIKRVRLFMFEDLDKTIGLASTPRGAPNFMLALALSAYTEYWRARACPEVYLTRCGIQFNS